MDCCFYYPLGYDGCYSGTAGPENTLFVVNANLKFPGTQRPAQPHFIDGIVPVTWDVLLADMMSHLASGASVAVNYVEFPEKRYFALFDLYYLDTVYCNCCPPSSTYRVSHFGQEVLNVPPKVQPPRAATVSTGTVQGCPHHVQVKKNLADSYVYHVATKQ
jgi:hypothetical protein